MDIRKAYKVMQAEWLRINDVRIGDIAEITRLYARGEMGFRGIYSPDTWVGRQGEIQGIWDDGVYVRNLGNNPFFALKIVKKASEPEPEKMVDVDGK